MGTLPVHKQTVKRTNKIITVIPLLDAIDIEGKEITADALLTQRKIAQYLVEKRHAHYHFTVKNNQPGLFQDIALYFEDRQGPDFVACDPPEHGQLEIGEIWTTTELNGYLDFPHVRQAFLIQPESIDKKTGQHSCETGHGISSRSAEQAEPQHLLATNRGHRCLENSFHYIGDWNCNEEHSRIRTGYGPKNMT